MLYQKEESHNAQRNLQSFDTQSRALRTTYFIPGSWACAQDHVYIYGSKDWAENEFSSRW